MKTIPQQVLAKFEVRLCKKNIPTDQTVHYRKWLRYYIDFCFKYQFDPKKSESLPDFINKLRDKKTK